MPIDWNNFTQTAPTTSATDTTKPVDWNSFTQQSANTAEVSTGADQSANPAAAAISGLSNAGSNVLFEAPIKAVTWLGEKLGVIDPKIAQHMKDEVSADAEKWFKSSENTPKGDVFNESRMKYPAASAIPQAALEVGLLSKAMPPAVKTTSPLGSLAANTAVQSGSSALMSAGLAGNSTKDQDTAATVGAFIPPLVSGLGAGIKSGASALATRLGLTDTVKKIVSSISQDLVNNNQLSTSDKAAQSVNNMVTKAKEIENEQYNTIREVPGTIKIAPIQKTTRDILTDNPKLATDQAAIFERISQDAGKIRTMDDAIRFKQSLGDYYTKLKGTAVYQDFLKLRSQVDNSIALKAEQAGLGNDWKAANNYHKQVIDPLNKNGAVDLSKAFNDRERDPSTYADAVKTVISTAKRSPQQMKALLLSMDETGSKIIEQDILKTTLDDVVVNPEAFDKNKALRTINQNINKFQGVLSNDSINAMKGVKKLLQKGGATEAKQGLAGATNSSYFQHSLGAGVGGAVGSAFGPVGSVIGGVAGIGILPPILKVAGQLLESPQGLAILKSIGLGRPWTKHLGDIIKAAGVDLIGKGHQ